MTQPALDEQFDARTLVAERAEVLVA